MATAADRRRPALADLGAAVILSLAVALLWWGWARFDGARARERAADLEVVTMHRAVAALRQNQQDIISYEPRYRALSESGSVGSFDKPRALDRFGSATRQFGNQLRDFSLAGQVPAELPGTAAGLQSHTAFRHQLKFELRPAHEEALLAMLEAIGAGAGGTSAIESCDLTGTGADTENQFELSAQCTLNWYSFAPAGTSTGAATAAPPLVSPSLPGRRP